MKAQLVPVYFKSSDALDFSRQLLALKELLAEDAEFFEPLALGQPVPEGADGVIFPDMLGDAYRRLEEISALPQPIMVVTSEFGTVSMWDWEINSYLSAKGVSVIAPNTLEKARIACRALALKRSLKTAKFLAYQDNPAAGGLQDEIFKRFYWWEPECVAAIEQRYGLRVVKKSFKQLAEDARAIPDEDAQAVWTEKQAGTPVDKISNRQILGAVKLYMKARQDLDADPSIIAVGMNCLNESMYCETTPCLAWNWLWEERGMVWGCEGDLVSMLTELLVARTLGVPFMMSNLYPFVMGQAALKHEHIPEFPQVAGDPKDHILMAHCGYLGVVPRSFSMEWTLRDKVLAIVNDCATAIDARMATGPVTLVKLAPPFDRWSVMEGDLPQYAQYPGSHCLNGAVIRVPGGEKMVDTLVSHHAILTTGHNLNALEIVSKVFDLEILKT